MGDTEICVSLSDLEAPEPRPASDPPQGHRGHQQRTLFAVTQVPPTEVGLGATDWGPPVNTCGCSERVWEGLVPGETCPPASALPGLSWS